MSLVLTRRRRWWLPLTAHHRHDTGISNLLPSRYPVILTIHSTVIALELFQFLLANSTGPDHQLPLLLLWKFSAWIVASALGIIASVWHRIYLVSFSWNGHSYYIYSGAFVLCWALVHRQCPSVVIFILFPHRPSRLVGLQYGQSACIPGGRLVNIPVGAIGRGLLIILLFNPDLEWFGHDLDRYSQSSSLGRCLNCLSWCHSLMVSRDAVWWQFLTMPFGRQFGIFGDHFRSRSELLW